MLLGVHNVRNASEIQRVSVEKAFPHKDYNATDFKNDIMLLKVRDKMYWVWTFSGVISSFCF